MAYYNRIWLTITESVWPLGLHPSTRAFPVGLSASGGPQRPHGRERVTRTCRLCGCGAMVYRSGGQATRVSRDDSGP